MGLLVVVLFLVVVLVDIRTGAIEHVRAALGHAHIDLLAAAGSTRPSRIP
jgi:hypothetical protein